MVVPEISIVLYLVQLILLPATPPPPLQHPGNDTGVVLFTQQEQLDLQTVPLFRELSGQTVIKWD